MSEINNGSIMSERPARIMSVASTNLDIVERLARSEENMIPAPLDKAPEQ